jgi:dTMP kinase
MKLLYDHLCDRGHRVVVTREPGGTAIAERIRALLLDPGAREMDSKTEALLYAASRAQHASEVIMPALQDGAIVLCDRYLDSSLAYQGVARGLGVEDVLRLNVWATDELLPDLVVLLNLDPEVGLSRTRGMPDRIEQESIAFHRLVGEAYLDLAKANPSRFTVVDSSLDAEKVQAEVQSAVEPLLAALRS